MRLALRTLFLGGAAALAATAAAAQATLPAPPPGQPVYLSAAPSEPTLHLSAYGEVEAAPDMATVSFGVVTEAATAAEAMRLNGERMRDVLAVLKRSGTADKDVQTSGLNLSPQYDYRDNQTPRLRGYRAANIVTVTVYDLTRVGRTLDAVVEAGVNQVDGVGFGLRDPQAAENAARLKAVEALRAKAELYARATGHSLTGLKSLSEGGGYGAPPPIPVVMRREMATAADTSVANVVRPGELTLRVDVSGVFGIAPR
jgi:uncharacterized protein YggE